MIAGRRLHRLFGDPGTTSRQWARPTLSTPSPLGLSRHLPPVSLLQSHCPSQRRRSVFLPSIVSVRCHKCAYKPPCRPGSRYRSGRCSSRVHPRYRRGLFESVSANAAQAPACVTCLNAAYARYREPGVWGKQKLGLGRTWRGPPAVRQPDPTIAWLTAKLAL